jgi:hypothetical protein
MALKYGSPVVSMDFIHDSVSHGKLQPTDNYLLVGKTKAEQFGTGKISGNIYLYYTIFR